MKKWLVFILLVSGVSSLEASASRFAREVLKNLAINNAVARANLKPQVIVDDECLSPVSTVASNAEEASPSSAASPFLDDLMPSGPLVLSPVLSAAKEIGVPFIVWMRYPASSGDGEQYFEVKKISFFTFEYLADKSVSAFELRNSLAREIKKNYGVTVESVYFGRLEPEICADTGQPILKAPSFGTRTDWIAPFQRLTMVEPVENVTEYCNMFGHLHVIVSLAL